MERGRHIAVSATLLKGVTAVIFGNFDFVSRLVGRSYVHFDPSSLKRFKYVAKMAELDDVIDGAATFGAEIWLHGAEQSSAAVGLFFLR